MKGVPEESEVEVEGGEEEVWSSRTDSAPKLPVDFLKQTSMVAEEEEGDWEDLMEGIPEPPDGGWGWVVVAASFFCNMVVDGIAYSFGIFLVHFVSFYRSSKGETSWIGSLLTGCYLTAGPLVSALTNKFGCRPVTMAGSVISSLAFLLSTCAPNVQVLMFTYGIMGGIGFGLIYLPAIVGVGHYFSTKRAFATGLAVCGSGMGAFVFAPVTQALLDAYDWKGALVLLAGFALNCAVFGALMRPLEPVRRRRKMPPAENRIVPVADTPLPEKSSDSGLLVMINEEPGVQSTLDLNDASRAVAALTESSNLLPPDEPTASLLVLKGNEGKPNGAIKTSRSQVNMKDFQRRFTMPAVMPASAVVLCPSGGGGGNRYSVQRNSIRDASWSTTQSRARRTRVPDRKDLARPLYRKDIFYSGSIVHLPQFQSSKNDVRSYVASVTTIPCSEKGDGPGDDDVTDPLPSTDGRRWRCPTLPKSMTHTLREVLDFSLLAQPPFLLACVANVFGMMGFFIPFVYLTDSSAMKGIDRDRAAFLISVLGITNLIGRLLFGWLVDRPKVRALDVNNACLAVGGVAIIVVPFCHSYAAIVTASSVFSIFASAYISLTSIILVDMVGLDRLTNSFGLLSLFRGAASIVGPPLAGTVFDMTNSYDIPFFMAGGLLLLSSFCTSLVPWLTRRCDTAERKKQEEAEGDGGLPPEVSSAL